MNNIETLARKLYVVIANRLSEVLCLHSSSFAHHSFYYFLLEMCLSTNSFPELHVGVRKVSLHVFGNIIDTREHFELLNRWNVMVESCP
jgi:hypothetical protein